MIKFNKDKCIGCNKCIAACKFGAIKFNNGVIEINDSCVNCNSCIKACKFGALSIKNEKVYQDDFNDYKGILVFIQIENNDILPLSYQLIAKAKDLSNKLNEKVYAVYLSSTDFSSKLDNLGIDKVYNFSSSSFNEFDSILYINALKDLIQDVKPSIVLIGATNEGRQIAAHLAHNFNTGLTADCTDLRIVGNNLLQVRPAYGGKIMAEILTEYSRPQFATVKNGVFDMPEIDTITKSKFIKIDKEYTNNKVEKISKIKKDNSDNLEKADIILCLGNAVKEKADMDLFYKVANKLNAVVAGSRALVEKGFIPQTKQIGLSGAGVSPKLLILFGVSGSIQFLAGIKGCKNIIAVNSDKNANILKVANYSIVDDIYNIANKILNEKC